jgi:hypothetical protein
MVNGEQEAWNNFAVTQQLDLTRFCGTTYAILLAWDEGHSLTQPLNRFQPKRMHRDSLLRLVRRMGADGSLE